MVVDAHIHFIPEKLARYTSFYKGVWADKRQLYSYLDKYRIGKGLLCYPTTDARAGLGSYARVCEVYNSEIQKLLAENDKLLAAGIVDVADVKTAVSEIGMFRRRGFSAVSLPSSFDGKFKVKELRPVFDAAAENNLVVFVHPQTSNPIGVERVDDPLLMPVLEYTFDVSMFLGLLMMEGVLTGCATKFVFASLGGVMPFLKDRFDRVYEMLRMRGMVKDIGAMPSDILRNVYVDTAGASVKNIQLAIDMFGTDKILWGSDYPVSGNVEGNLSALDSLGLEIKEKIVSKNFHKLFGECDDEK